MEGMAPGNVKVGMSNELRMLTCRTATSAQQQGDQKRSEGVRAEKVELRHGRFRLRREVDKNTLDQRDVEPARAQDEDELGVGAPDFRAIELEQHEAAGKDDAGEDFLFAKLGRMIPGHSETEQHQETERNQAAGDGA
jgi:hypothetical protein